MLTDAIRAANLAKEIIEFIPEGLTKSTVLLGLKIATLSFTEMLRKESPNPEVFDNIIRQLDIEMRDVVGVEMGD